MDATLIIDKNNTQKKKIIQYKEEEILEKYSSLNKQDPYTRSGIFKRLLVIWAFKIIKLSNYISLKSEYLGNLPEKYQSKNYINDLKEIWYNKQYKNKKFLPLIRSAFLSNKLLVFYLMITVLFKSLMDAIKLSLFREFMSRFVNEKNNNYYIYSFFSQTGIAILFILFRIIHVLLWIKSLEYQCVLSYKVSAQFQCLIFEKLLKINISSIKEKFDSGKVINYIQIDSQKLINLISSSPDLFCLPLQIIIYYFMLYQILGGIFFFGSFILIIFICSNLFFQKKIKSYVKIQMKLKDKRMKITTETLNNIKILKLYSWEDEFKNKIYLSRENELNNLLKKFKLMSLNTSIQWAGPVITSILCIGLYQYFKGEFKIEDIFTSLSLFNKLQIPLRLFPQIITNCYETSISMKRIENYLNQDEINEKNVIRNNNILYNNGIRIKIENGDFSWGIPIINNLEKIEGCNNEKNKFKKYNNNNNKNEKNENFNEGNIELTDIKIKKEEINNNNKEIKNKIENLLNHNKEINTKKNITNSKITLNEKLLNPEIKIENRIIKNENNEKELKTINSLKPILKNINFEILNGELICIIGDVGSGKSSLLECILNNLLPLNINTKIYINGTIAYVSQIPWICNTTVKNNIIFNNILNEEKYNNIINITCLKHDLEILEGGDLTEIGEKGINLSGGQKARIALARALYSEKDIFIFDDPISALDSNIGMEIMNNCILKYLKGKTRILVTHALQYISFADRIIFMKQGEIKWIGNFNQLKKQSFFIEFKMKEDEEKKKKEENDEEKYLKNKSNNNNYNELNNGIIKRITKDEKLEKDKIKLSVIKSYIKYMGGIKIPIIIILFLLIMAIFKSSSDIFLSFWSSNQSKEKNNKFFFIYSSLSLGSCIFNYCLLLINSYSSIRESRELHTLIINSLISAPITTFHERIPKGQIFNRLSKDIENIDNNAINQMNSVLSSIIDFFTSLIICSIFETYSLILVPFLIFIGFSWAKFNIKCSRNLYRIEGIARSPILNIINEAIPGNIIIRAYNAEKYYLDKFYKRIDEHFKIRIILNGTGNLHDLFLNFLSIIFVIFLVIFCLIYKNNFSASQIGLILTYYEIINTSIFRGLHTFKRFQNSMVDFERCVLLTNCPREKKPKENKLLNLLDNTWPLNGKIQFENYSVKYREDTELVLKNINLIINPNEKIGIVGRTGSGKSTITLCLFRILEATSGKILIDDIDISKIGLDKLRKNITIIPQDPLLMEGTLKYNIDPFNLNTNDDIIKIMKIIGFDYIIKRNSEGLLQKISEGGNNLSIGEKQLICIIRAILRKSKIFIMDEATSSIDYKSEDIIQNVIFQLLNQCTVITIAHRIKTILNYDKILVLDNGVIVDYDSPKNLLDKKKGIFFELYQKSNF